MCLLKLNLGLSTKISCFVCFISLFFFLSLFLAPSPLKRARMHISSYLLLHLETYALTGLAGGRVVDPR